MPIRKEMFWNNLEKKIFPGVGPYDIPEIKPEKFVDCKYVRFNEAQKIKDPSVKKNTKKFPLHPFELVWYILVGLVGIWGLTYIVLGTIASYLPIQSEDPALVKANDKILELFKLDMLGWGLIILAIAAVAAVVVLILFSNKVDRDYEKNVRRAQRLAQLEAEEAKEESIEEQKIVVDAEVQPVEEKKEEVVINEAPKEEQLINPNKNLK